MTKIVARFCAVIIAAIALRAASFQVPQPPRDIARPQTGTAMLSGVVMTDEPVSQPVRRATVALALAGGERAERLTTTDETGHFVFSDLPAGNVVVSAAKAAYVTSYFGAKSPGSTIGVPIAIAEGQRAPAITIKMLRGAVVTGLVSDELGRPMPQVNVRLQRVTTTAAGERALTQVNPNTPGNTTDDRGVYRIFGLVPGDYLVSAQPRITAGGVMNALAGELRQTTAADVQWAERQLQSAGTSAAADVMAPKTGTVAYADVFYPGAVNPAAATIVSLTAGQERAGTDLRMQFISTASISGTVAGPDGQPAAQVQVTLLHKGAATTDLTTGLALMSMGIQEAGYTAVTRANGVFAVTGVAPGQYTLVARGPSAGRAGSPAPPTPGAWATTDLDVNGQNIDGVALTLEAGRTVSGRVLFDATRTTPPADLARATIRLTPAQPGGIAVAVQSVASAMAAAGLQPSREGLAGASGLRFSVDGVVPGQYRLGAVLPSWTLKSAMLDGRDVADVPFEVKPGMAVNDVVLTFTDAAAELSGTLLDATNHPTSDLSIILFAADRSMWFQGSRRVRTPVRAASDGKFSFTGLAPGEYYLAALADFQPNEVSSPQFLEQVVPSAIKITIAAGEKKVQDLKMTGGGER